MSDCQSVQPASSAHQNQPVHPAWDLQRKGARTCDSITCPSELDHEHSQLTAVAFGLVASTCAHGSRQLQRASAAANSTAGTAPRESCTLYLQLVTPPKLNEGAPSTVACHRRSCMSFGAAASFGLTSPAVCAALPGAAGAAAVHNSCPPRIHDTACGRILLHVLPPLLRRRRLQAHVNASRRSCHGGSVI